LDDHEAVHLSLVGGALGVGGISIREQETEGFGQACGALAGIGIGLAAAMAATRFVESLLYAVSPRDPAVFVATTTLLIVVAVCACWVPARRAAQVNPVEALRAE